MGGGGEGGCYMHVPMVMRRQFNVQATIQLTLTYLGGHEETV